MRRSALRRGKCQIRKVFCVIAGQKEGRVQTNLLLQLGVGDGSLRGRDRTVVDQGGPLAVPVGDMPIDRIVAGVCFSADEPTALDKEVAISVIGIGRFADPQRPICREIKGNIYHLVKGGLL